MVDWNYEWRIPTKDYQLIGYIVSVLVEYLCEGEANNLIDHFLSMFLTNQELNLWFSVYYILTRGSSKFVHDQIIPLHKVQMNTASQI